MTHRPLPSIIALLVILVSACNAPADSSSSEKSSPEPYEYALVLHGGAGNMNFQSVPEELQNRYKHVLDSALQLGLDVLKEDGTSIDAVEVVIRCMEDNPLFNAGKGAVFTSEGKNELDASIMSGQDLNAGAVAGVTNIKHPISAARAVMEQSEHVMMAGKGASVFAEEVGLEIVDPSYFYTERRFKSYQKAIAKDKHGTVGCVALDKAGNLCAGTSTGGMTNKKYGRIGDSPIIGAGTYANNATCGVSGTGHGEYFIRWTVAHQISVLMEYKGYDVESAAREVVEKTLAEAGGEGGVICLDSYGRPAMVTNTSGMFRAYGNSEGERVVAIFK
ncbi:MAG: isoaspartyl peptidase/L-asparaginase [Bacteroidales bacterium]|nr:isoaspartyl peptidase/L-asparaginase [Bacteroidales bacterium]